MTSSSHPAVAPEEWSEIDRTTWAGEAPGPDPIGEAAHAIWDALDLASMAAGRDPDAPHTLDTADQPMNTEPGVWGLLAVWGTTPVRITVEHARPEEAAALGMDGNAHDPDLLCVATDDGGYQQPAPEPDPLRHGGRHGPHEHGPYAPHTHSGPGHDPLAEVRADHEGVPAAEPQDGQAPAW